jgi:hypothetical protein
MTPNIPIPKQPDVTQIERLRPLVADRRCVVIGSAPLRTRLVEICADELTIPVNGGISSLANPADVWVVNSKAQDAPGAIIRPLHKQMLEQAAIAAGGAPIAAPRAKSGERATDAVDVGRDEVHASDVVRAR